MCHYSHSVSLFPFSFSVYSCFSLLSAEIYHILIQKTATKDGGSVGGADETIGVTKEDKVKDNGGKKLPKCCTGGAGSSVGESQ